MAKDRVAPVKGKVRTDGSLLGAWLCKFVSTSLNHLHFRVFMWSDSQITLHWLSSKKTLHPFIANRVQEIHELLPEFPWKYCPTQDNSADLVTIGISLNFLTDSLLWRFTLPWLSRNHSDLNGSTVRCYICKPLMLLLEDSQRSDEASLHHTGSGWIIDIECYSDLSKLLQVSTYVCTIIYPQLQATHFNC